MIKHWATFDQMVLAMLLAECVGGLLEGVAGVEGYLTWMGACLSLYDVRS